MKFLHEIKDWQEMKNQVICGDCLEGMRLISDNSVDCCITSPPYWGLRDYGVDGQLGLEKTPDEYVAKMVLVFREVKRILKNSGTLWLNLGDSYAGSGKGQSFAGSTDPKRGKCRGMKLKASSVGVEGLKHKDLVGIPWRVAFALQADGWYLRQDIIWSKPNCMPESVLDRCTKSHEYIFLLSKKPNYYFNNNAIQEPAQNWGTRDRTNFRSGTTDPKLKHHGLKGSDEENQTRNKRTVWTVSTKPYSEAHFATFPSELIEPMILAGCPEKGLILDPFMGAFTTARTAKDMVREFIGFELSEKYCKIGEERLRQEVLF